MSFLEKELIHVPPQTQHNKKSIHNYIDSLKITENPDDQMSLLPHKTIHLNTLQDLAW